MTRFQIRDLNKLDTEFHPTTRKFYKNFIRSIDRTGRLYRVETVYNGVHATKNLTVLR